MRHFEVVMEVIVHVEAEEAVIDRVLNNEDGWRETFYDLREEDQVADHLAWNLGVNGSRLNQLDGWADMPAEAATARIIGTRVDEVLDLDATAGGS